MFEIGNSLREARLRQGLEFPEIEYATKIRSKYLRALEEEQFEILPAQTYVKGFLRTYAEYLGLDGELYVDEYNSRFITGEEETPLRARQAAPRHERRVQSRMVLAVVVGIAVITALVIAAWKFSGSGGKNQIRGLNPPATTVKKKGKKKTKTVVGSRTVTLDVRATHGSGSYLEVRAGSVGGRQMFAGTISPGERQFFRSGRLWFTIRAPANVAVRVNGNRRTLPGHGYPRVLVASPGGKLRLATAGG